MKSITDSEHLSLTSCRLSDVKTSRQSLYLLLVWSYILILTGGCGMILEDPHPYPDMGEVGGSLNESNEQRNLPPSEDSDSMNSSVDQE